MTAQDIILDEFICHYLGDEVMVDDAFAAGIPAMATASARRLARKSGDARGAVISLLLQLRTDRTHPLLRTIGDKSLLWWADDDESWHAFEQLVDAIIAQLGAA